MFFKFRKYLSSNLLLNVNNIIDDLSVIAVFLSYIYRNQITPHMADVINATTKQRHESIFSAYILVMQEHGTDARNLSKKSMYDEVAQRTGYSMEYVAKIITMKFRENNHVVKQCE